MGWGVSGETGEAGEPRGNQGSVGYWGQPGEDGDGVQGGLSGPRITLEIWGLAGAAEGCGLAWAGLRGTWRECGVGSQVSRSVRDIGMGYGGPRLGV